MRRNVITRILLQILDGFALALFAILVWPISILYHAFKAMLFPVILFVEVYNNEEDADL